MRKGAKICKFKTVERSKNRRKNAKTIGVFFVDRLLAIFQWPYSGDQLLEGKKYTPKVFSARKLKFLNRQKKRFGVYQKACFQGKKRKIHTLETSGGLITGLFWKKKSPKKKGSELIFFPFLFRAEASLFCCSHKNFARSWVTVTAQEKKGEKGGARPSAYPGIFCPNTWARFAAHPHLAPKSWPSCPACPTQRPETPPLKIALSGQETSFSAHMAKGKTGPNMRNCGGLVVVWVANKVASATAGQASERDCLAAV